LELEVARDTVQGVIDEFSLFAVVFAREVGDDFQASKWGFRSNNLWYVPNEHL
jgi:hypothetical protein